MRLCLVASKPTDSVIFGFLPAAAGLGLDVVLLTDQPEEHKRALARSRRQPRPGCAGHDEGHRPDALLAGNPVHVRNTAHARNTGLLRDTGRVRIQECDVWDARQLIGAIAALPAPDAIFSNSDHLQTQTALAAAYFGVPGKDWRSSMRAKNKSLMRRRLSETGTEHVAAVEIRPRASDTFSADHPASDLAYPVVLKPAEGVASEDVILVRSPQELEEQSARIFARRPGETLLAEQYLPGGLRTLETLGDGVTTWVLGGFRTSLSPLPFFIEERLTWDAPVPEEGKKHVLGALAELGATFGACHTEYVLDDGNNPALIEVNDRIIGDDCDFVLSDLLGVDLFELVLRIYLGESLPPGPPPEPVPGRAHAIIDYVVADRSGRLAASPSAGPQRSTEPDVMLSYRPLREVGDRITLTHTNRDYLGVITAIGPEAAPVELSVAGLRTSESWEITESGS